MAPGLIVKRNVTSPLFLNYVFSWLTWLDGLIGLINQSSSKDIGNASTSHRRPQRCWCCDGGSQMGDSPISQKFPSDLLTTNWSSVTRYAKLEEGGRWRPDWSASHHKTFSEFLNVPVFLLLLWSLLFPNFTTHWRQLWCKTVFIQSNWEKLLTPVFYSLKIHRRKHYLNVCQQNAFKFSLLTNH